MTEIMRVGFPTFTFYTDSINPKEYKLNDAYKSYMVTHKSGYDTIYEIVPSWVPDGFIEDMTLWGASDVIITEEEKVLDDTNSDVYTRTITYYCKGNSPKVEIVESGNCAEWAGYADIKIIISGRWSRK